jgi:hypothetical protein
MMLKIFFKTHPTIIVSIVHFVFLDKDDPHHQPISIIQESSVLVGVVQFSTLVCEIPIFEIPLPLIDGNPTNIHVSSTVLLFLIPYHD